MKKIKLRYLDSIVNAKYSSLEKKSTKGSLIETNGELEFERKEGVVPIEKITAVEPQQSSSFRVENWVKVNYQTNGEHQTTYLTRRSFYHPSTKKIAKKLKTYIR